jgi:hypothetical protein
MQTFLLRLRESRRRTAQRRARTLPAGFWAASIKGVRPAPQIKTGPGDGIELPQETIELASADVAKAAKARF